MWRHEGLAQAEQAAPLLVLAVVAPQADGKEARKERAPIHFPIGHVVSFCLSNLYGGSAQFVVNSF